jgi:hypothetical protein
MDRSDQKGNRQKENKKKNKEKTKMVMASPEVNLCREQSNFEREFMDAQVVHRELQKEF